MANKLRQATIGPKGMGLNDWVAMEKGYFAAEGLDVEFDMKTFRGMQSSWRGLEYFERPQDRPYGESREVMQGACSWGSVCNASAGMGRFVADAFGISPWAIYVRPDSSIRTPVDLRNVPVAVGMRAGSHFNVPYRLETFLPLAEIKTVNVGGFGTRLKALIEGEVEAASLLPPEIDMAEQLGLRRIISNTFHTLWWAPESMPSEVVSGYLGALDRAERDLQADLKSHLALWKHSIPPMFQDRDWDFSRFTRGERFVHQKLPQAEFDEILAQVDRWDLGQYLKDTTYEGTAYAMRG